MTTTDYLINAVFVFVVLRQARERTLDLRSIVVPLLVVCFVAHNYVHTIPTAGNDLEWIALLACVGTGLGALSGFATHLRLTEDGQTLVRVGRAAAVLLIAGISARLLFAFAVQHGFGPDVRAFSIAHTITTEAWPVALVAMALCEVTVRLLTVQLRARRLAAGSTGFSTATA